MIRIKEFVERAADSAVPFIEHANSIGDKGYKYTTQIIHELISVATKKNDYSLELLLILASRDGLNNSYTEILCSLLRDDWHELHEDIIMMLEEIKDQSSIGCIFESALNIPDYDDGRSLAKKCIWALGAINTMKSREKLELLKMNKDPIISEAASMEIKHILGGTDFI